MSVVFPLMASPPSEDDELDEDDEDDEVEDGTEASRPCAVASQVKYRTRAFIYGTVSMCTMVWLSNIVCCVIKYTLLKALN